MENAPHKSSGVNGSIKEPRRDTQCANLVASGPRGTDLFGFGIHVTLRGAELRSSEAW